MQLKIITDSACDLPAALIKEYDIHVLPFLVYIDEQEYIDGQTIQAQQVYAAIRAGKVPTTSQVPTHLFYEAFLDCARQNRPCLYLALSSKLSGTYNASRLVLEDIKRQYPQAQISVCDTLSGSLGQGLIVLEAAQMALAGAKIRDIEERVHLRSKNNVEHVFSVDDLNYLYRGGRVSYTSAFLGGVLNVKPILHVHDGSMIPIQKVRGKNNALKRIVELVKERSLGNLEQIVAITHADDLESAQRLQRLLQTALGYRNFVVNIVGSVLGCHIGLGGVAAFFVNSAVKIPNLPQPKM